MMPKLSILTALLLSAAGTSALSIADLGLMVLPDQGNAKNTDKCTATEFNNLAVDLDETARTFQDNYTRKLQSNSSINGEESMDLDIADAAAQFLAPEFDALAEELFTAALGRGLLRLPKFALPKAAEER